MAVRIVEAFDRADEFPAFMLITDQAFRTDGQGWRDRTVWRFEFFATTERCIERPLCWAIQTKVGAPLASALDGLRRRAASRYFRQVAYCSYRPPPTIEDIETIERFNRKNEAERQQARRKLRHATRDQKATPARRRSLGLV